MQQVLDEKNEWQDACILGSAEPLEWFDGEVIAEVEFGDQTVWAVVPEGSILDAETVSAEMSFLGMVQKVTMF